jgi:hypothetical protein
MHQAGSITLRGTNTPNPVCACVRGLPPVRNQYRESSRGSRQEKGNDSVRVEDELHCVGATPALLHNPVHC